MKFESEVIKNNMMQCDAIMEHGIGVFVLKKNERLPKPNFLNFRHLLYMYVFGTKIPPLTQWIGPMFKVTNCHFSLPKAGPDAQSLSSGSSGYFRNKEWTF